MTDPTDNVSRLESIAKTMDAGDWHSLAKVVREAAEEIQRLRMLLCAAESVADAKHDIPTLIRERDEARRSVCEMCVQIGLVFRRVGGKTVEVTTAEGCAEIMRWDCFKGETP